MTHDELQSLLGAYALDALETDEQALVDSHLRECPRCRAEVAAHRETAALIGNFGGEAPREVWDRIAAGLPADKEPAPPLPGHVLPFRRRVPLALFAGAAAAGVAIVALLGVSTIRLQHRVDNLRRAVADGGVQQAAAAVLLDPNHTSVRLASADGRLSAEAVVSPDGAAYLLDGNLPSVGSSRTYQLWGVDAGRVVSLGLLGSAPDVAAFRVDSSVSRLMVTVEPRGGSPRPDTQALIQGNVPA